MTESLERTSFGSMIGKNCNEFDPMSLDTSVIKGLSSSIPADGNIDINIAEVLATKFLRGADMCAELIAIATAHVARIEAEKKRAYGYAASVKASNNNIKAAAVRSWFADQDEEYLEASNRHAEAVAFLRWVKSKHDSFIKAHHLSKDILKRSIMHESAGSWNGIVDDEKDNFSDFDSEKAW